MIIGKSRTNQPVEDEGKVDARIESLVEGGTLSNAKPIYYHPIYYYVSINGVTVLCLQCAILDNNSIAYTTETFIAKIKSLMSNGALINVNGWYKDANNVFNDVIVLYYSSDAYRGDVFNPTGTSDFNLDTLLNTEGATQVIVDGVNKIN